MQALRAFYASNNFTRHETSLPTPAAGQLVSSNAVICVASRANGHAWEDVLGHGITGACGGFLTGVLTAKTIERGARFAQVEAYMPYQALVGASALLGMTVLVGSEMSVAPDMRVKLRSLFFAQLGSIPGSFVGGAVGFGAGAVAIVVEGSRDPERARLFVGAGIIGGCLVGGCVAAGVVGQIFWPKRPSVKNSED